MSTYVYKRMSIDDVVPGMILGKMLVTQDGKNFLNEGAVLTLRVIQTLQTWGFRSVDIREEVRDIEESNRQQLSFSEPTGMEPVDEQTVVVAAAEPLAPPPPEEPELDPLAVPPEDGAAPSVIAPPTADVTPAPPPAAPEGAPQPAPQPIF